MQYSTFRFYSLFFVWKCEPLSSRLPPEGVIQAIISGSRYVAHSVMLRRILVRIFLFGLTGATATGLAPLIAKDLLGGDAAVFGIILGAGGAGAVVGALFVSYCRARFGTELATRALIVVTSLALIVAGLSTQLFLTCLAMFIAGAANILIIALYNVAVQLSAPRWVLARTLSFFGASLTGGIALGAWTWGEVASISSVSTAVTASGLTMMILPIISILLPLKESTLIENEAFTFSIEPEIELPITMRSGPIIVEIDYRVSNDAVREFYIHMTKLRSPRLRNGGYNWSISRDIADDNLWTERYECRTWGD